MDNLNFRSAIYKHAAVLMIFVFFGSTNLLAQNTLEFAKISGDGNPTWIGPVTSTTVNFLQNTTGNTFTSYNSPALSATVAFTNQQYASGASAVAPLGVSIVMGYSATAPDAIYTTGAWNGSPSNSTFTSVNSATGKGISTTDNYVLGVRNFIRAIGVQNSRAKVYVGRMEVTFNRPVTNPIIHVSGFGGQFSGLYYTTTLDLNASQSIATSTISLTRLSGTNNFSTAGNSISNNFSVVDFNGSGSVRIVGTNISKVSFDVYLDGSDTNTNTTNSWSDNDYSGDAFDVSFSVSQALPSISGTVYIDNNGSANIDNGGSGGTTWNLANTLYVNAVGANGNVIATSPVSGGSFTFSANGVMVEGQVVQFQLSRFQGTIGQPPPVIDLPGGWTTVGESIIGGTSDGTPNGEFTLTIPSANSNINTYRFGVTTCSAGTTAPVIVSNITNVCPATTANLATAHLEPIPSGATLVWFTNNLHTGTALTAAQISAIATNGTYYAFYYSATNNCYSPASSPVTVTIINRVDSDGDGVADECDLDDDNDGILDNVECPPTNAVTNGTFNTNLSGWSAGSGWSYGTIGGNGLATNLNNSVNPSILSQPLNNLNNNYNGFVAVNLRIGSQDYSYSSGSSGSLDVTLNGVVYATFTNGTLRNNSNITLALSNGASSNFQTFGTVGNSVDYAQSAPFTIFIPYTGPSSAVLAFRMFASSIGDDWSLDDISINTFACDTDGDGIPNYLDLDSDNDGCPDAIEGASTTITPSNLVSSAMPGGNTGATSGAYNQPVVQNLGNTIGSTTTTLGVPTVAGTGQAIGTAATANPVLVAGTAAANQAIAANTTPAALTLTGSTGAIQWQVSTNNSTFTNVASAGNASSYAPGTLTVTTYYRAILTSAGGCTTLSNTVMVRVLPDSDGDGIADEVDLDDDNDGILDTDECPTIASNMIEWRNNTNNFPSAVLPPGVGFITGNDSGVGTGVTRTKHANNFQVISQVDAVSETQAITNNEYVEYRINVGTRYLIINQIGYYSVPTSNTTPYTFSLRVSDDNFATSSAVHSPYNYVSIGTDFIINTTNPLYLNPNTTYIFRVYFYNVSGGASASIAHDDFKLFGLVECDTDNDGIPNRLDLDSDNDGCSDAIEGASTTITNANLVNSAMPGGNSGATSGSYNLPIIQNLGNTVNTTSGSASYGIPIIAGTGQGAGYSADALINVCCVNFPIGGLPDSFTKTGISNLVGFVGGTTGWPGNVPNGFIAIESKRNGFVITRVKNVSDIPTANLIEGMLVYDIAAACVKLYNGTVWKCLGKDCN